jgi:hypothetical protein
LKMKSDCRTGSSAGVAAMTASCPGVGMLF